MNLRLIDQSNVHPDWKPFITEEIISIIRNIEDQISGIDFNPAPQNVFLFFNKPLVSAKIIILGQDPYPQPGVATGRAFEVGNLKSWNQPFPNISLKNILRAIYKAYTASTINFNDLKTKFDNEFPVLGPGRLFKYWESQGVLLLNTFLTCESGKPGSHRKIWESFSKILFSYINKANPDICWFLWGSDAIRAVSSLENIKSIESFHPMMCYDLPDRGNDFLFGSTNCFFETMDRIDWTGYGNKKIARGQDLFR